MKKMFFTILLICFCVGVFSQHTLLFNIPPCPHSTKISISDNHEDAIILYPNPACDIIEISITKFLEINSNFISEVYDIKGKVLLKQKIQAEEKTDSYLIRINIEKLDKGIHFIRIISNNQIFRSYSFIKI